MWDFPLFPESASSVSPEVDAFYFALCGVTAFFTIAIYLLILWFSVKYRRGKTADRSNPPVSNHRLEAIWIVLPLGIALAIFGWSAKIFFEIQTPPQDALQVHALGKQWMWKFVNEQGKYEVNELHVPVNRPVRITMISQDVLHDLFFPAFRVKQDVVPGRYSTLWFEATKTGTYDIFCAEYCGLLHSGMIGKVHVMEQEDYERWLAGNTGGTPEAVGEQLFTDFGCVTCHSQESGARGPALGGLFGEEVPLANGNVVEADAEYIRESIYEPQAKIVAGYQPIMPTFKGQINEEQIIALTAYIKTLQATEAEL